VIHSLARRVAFLFFTYGEASEEDLDIYAYSCELILSDVANVIVGILISALCGRLLEGLAFIGCFAILRRLTGGYHAKSHLVCITTFAVILTLSVLLLNVLVSSVVIACLGVVSVVILFSLAPTEHKNNPLSCEHRLMLRKQSRIAIVVLFIVSVCGSIFFKASVFTAMSLSSFAVSVSVAYATVINNMERKVE